MTDTNDSVLDWRTATEAPQGTDIITLDEGFDIMVKGDYSPDMFLDRWNQWLERGDIVIIFQNHDLGHRDVGHVMTMPWHNDRPLPQCAPDHAATGLGWRYLPSFVIIRK